MNNLRKELGIDEYLELLKEDKNLDSAYISFGQYIYILETKNKKLKEELKATRKGLNKVLSKRKKWKDRYYKEKRKNKEIEQQLEQKNKVIKKAIFKTKCIKEYGFDRIAKYKILETLNEGSGK